MEKNEEFIQLKGSVKVQLFDKDGNLKQSHEEHNLIVTAGKNYLAAWLQAASQAGKFMSYIAVGTGTTAPASGDTALEAELARVLGTLTTTSNTWTNTTTFNPGTGTGAVTEAGLFSASSSGTMFARQTFSAYNKAVGDTMVIAWTVTFN